MREHKIDLAKVAHYEPISRLDASTNIFFQRELETILTRMIEFEHARINARAVFPISNEVDPWARIFTWRQITHTGQAVIVADWADDVPTVNVKGEETSQNVRRLAAAGEWSLDEIRAAEAHGRSLPAQDAIAAREANLRKENTIAFSGDTAFGLTGFFSAINAVPTFAAPNGSWAAATADDILTDMHTGANKVVEDTGDVEIPNVMLLPTTQYNRAASLRVPDGTETVLSVFVRNNPYIDRVVPVRELATLGPGATPIAVFYRDDASKLEMHIPQEIEQLPPQVKNFITKVIWSMKTGGVTVYKPLSALGMTGI